jgi:FKBP-type peptidyl-prolyl cis-trans isomerase FkpA/FKBP-type peptidyl-prolyl cis-trans isomerase FklB
MHGLARILIGFACLLLPLAAMACGSDSDDDSTAASPAGGGFFDMENATTTASGLKYVDSVAGTGELPRADQTVVVNYTGKLASDGKVFDSTSGRGPATFPLNRVIPGFSEGILGMKTGGKRTIYIPAALAYAGSPPPGSGIPVNADLIFDIELISIQ